jgi:MarR family transcriptional regulator, multiple antibiotic resistance protein MarR
MLDQNQRDPKLLKEAMNMFRQVMMPLWHITRSKIHKMAIKGGYGITSAQFHTIRQIHAGIDSVSELAGCMHVSRPNISRLVDELVQEGFVERCRDDKDRRNIKLTLTENGGKLIQDLQNKYSEILADQFSVLDDKELTSMIYAFKSLKKIIDSNSKE